MAECSGKTCTASVVWAETIDGKKQPFDRVPNPEGNRVLLGRGPNRPPLAIPTSELLPHNPTYGAPDWLADCTYMPHHATCENVDRYRNG